MTTRESPRSQPTYHPVLSDAQDIESASPVSSRRASSEYFLASESLERGHRSQSLRGSITNSSASSPAASIQSRELPLQREVSPTETIRNDPDESQGSPSTLPEETSRHVVANVANEKIEADWKVAFPKWPYEGKDLEPGRKTYIFMAVVDVLILFIPVGFMVIAILCEVLSGKLTALYAWGLPLLTLKRYASFSYP